MRKGNVFEAHINKLIKYCTDNGFEAHKNNAQRTLDGTYIKGEPFDYEIFIPGLLICFDAKECNSDKWAITNAKPEQIWHLRACKRAGMWAFFYVWYRKKNRLVAFDVDFICRTDKKSLLPTDGEEVNIADVIQRHIVTISEGKKNRE